MNDADKRRIHELAAEGLGARAIARVVGSTHPTVAKILAQPAPLIELPEHMKPRGVPLEPSDDPADDAPALEQCRFLMAEARRALRSARATGDAQLEQRQTRNAAFLANVLARLEAAEQESSGEIRVSAQAFAGSEADLQAKLTALAERGDGVRCARCDREISIAFGLGANEIDQ